MFRNYLKTTFRNLWKNKGYSALNIGGLAIGLTCAILLYLYASREFGYDGYYKNADRIFRAYTHISLNGAESNGAKSSPPVAETFRTQFPEVETNTFVGYENAYDVRYKEKTFREYRIYTADSNYFKVFDHPVIKGKASHALLMPNEVVITETTAQRYFGDADPVGKQLLLNDTLALMVTAVMTDFPENSHFNADMLMSMSTFRGKNSENWLALGYSNFVMLKKGADAKALEQRLRILVDKGAGPQIEKLLNVHFSAFKSAGNTFEIKLQPLKEVYLYSKERYGIDPNTEWGHSRTGNILYVRIFIASALFVLLIAVFNFMNMATARSEKQAKETGIRKTLGSARWQLMMRYFIESITTTGISVLIALCIVYAVLPWFNQLIGKTASLNLFESIWSIPLLILFTIAVGIFAGSYPAVFLSAFQPVDTLKGLKRKNKITLRSILVVSQFAISIAMIIGMMAVRRQLDYMQHKDLGIKPDKLITITNGAAIGNKLEAFKQELLKNPAITSVTNSSLIFASGVPESAYTYENQSKTEPPLHAAYLDIDDSFINTFGIELKEGRFFDPSMPTDSSAVVINETAAKDFAPNVKSITGHRITMLSNRKIPMIFRVIGVTKDFNFESLHQKVKPLVLQYSKVEQPASYITVKFSGNDPEAIRTYTEGVWNSVNSIEKANCSFLNDTIESLYASEKKISALSTILSILGILVACLGLFGLAMFVTEQRKKEIGIRKILGAGVAEVTATISKQFVLWIAIANLIAWPAAYLILHQWLQNFAYNIKPAWWMFAGAGLITLFIALATISILSVKAALANPVNSLRTE
jgi:putative ABC transport system permease protein